MKLIQSIVLAVFIAIPGFAVAVPVTYILDGLASGSYDDEDFTGKRLGILIEADTETVVLGSEPYVPGSHPDQDWSTQAGILRIQTLFPFQTSDPIIPYPMGLVNPENLQLMSERIGAYQPVYSPRPPSEEKRFVALCSNGMSRYDCIDSSYAAFRFQVPVHTNLVSPFDKSATELSFNFDLKTYEGKFLSINDLQNARFEVRPVPEPSTLLFFGTGLAGFAAIGRRQRK